MIELYQHQREGVAFLTQRPSAGLWWEMGVGKSRTALLAAKQLFDDEKINRVLILAPAAVRFAWIEELTKLEMLGEKFNIVFYGPKQQDFSCISPTKGRLPILLVSYSLLPQDRHVKALEKWCFEGETALICDESSFLKSRTAKQTKGAKRISDSCCYCWLLTGTPIANSPLDLYGQALVMSNGNGPLKGFKNFYHFRARYAVTKAIRFGGGRMFQQVVGYQNIDELTKRFAPYVSRVEKKDALDLPPKSYSVREVALEEKTWGIYQELKREAMLALGEGESKPEPNAAVRLLRLCQLTSGHVGVTPEYQEANVSDDLKEIYAVNDVSSEKLDFLAESILTGELSNERALIVWCRWRRERERLAALLKDIPVGQIYGGQSQKEREETLTEFQRPSSRRMVLLAQPHAGGYGLTLTAASTAVYLSNTFSYTARVQSEDRCHRIGQHNPVTYIDIIAIGPKGQSTVDRHVLEALGEKKDMATMTCAAWRKALEDE